MKAFLLASATLLLAAPAYAQEAETITFATFGDHGDGPGATAVASLVKRSNVDYIVTVGDNCYLSPIAEQLGKNYGKYVSAGRFIASLGNHDYTNTCGTNRKGAGLVLYLNAQPARTRPAFWAQQHSVIAKTHCHSVYLEDTFANSISRGWP